MAKALRDEGIVPPGVDNPALYRQRSGECILPRNQDWWEASRPLRENWTAGEPDRVAEGTSVSGS
jgi:hypothetical protein